MKRVMLGLVFASLASLSASAVKAQTTYNSTSVAVNTGVPTAAVFSFADAQPLGTQVQIRCNATPQWWYYTGVGTPDYHAYGPFTLSGCTVTYGTDNDGGRTTTVNVPVQAPQTLLGGSTVTLDASMFTSSNEGRFHSADDQSGTSQITVQ